MLPNDVIEIKGSLLPVDRLWLALVIVALGGGVALLYRHTTFGLATRGAAECPKGAILLGRSPEHLGLGNWLLASLLAALAGVLMSPISGVNPFNYSLFVVPALAAALAARLRSFGVAIAVGMAIGMFEGLAVHLVSRRQVPTFLLGGIDSFVPFAAIVIVLVVFGRSVPDRGTVLDPRHPAVPPISRRPTAGDRRRRRRVPPAAVGDAGLRLASDHVDDGGARSPCRSWC